MNENLNLVEILEGCPKGTKFYSTIYGEVKFAGIKEGTYPVTFNKELLLEDMMSRQVIVEH